MRVDEFQARIRDFYLDKDRARGIEGTFLWFMEEVGELAVAVRERDATAAREELADVIAWAVSLANLLDVDLVQALASKYPEAACARCGSLPCACPE